MSTRNMGILNSVFIFATGLAIGSVVTWKYLTTRFEKETLDEIEEETHDEDEKSEDENKILDYADILKRSQYKEVEEGEDDDMKPVNDDIYVIPPYEFYNSNFDVVSLMLYTDGVVVNEYGEVIEEDEIERLVRKDSLTHFGEYDDDSVYVRNEGLATDYEILRSLLSYAESYD